MQPVLIITRSAAWKEQLLGLFEPAEVYDVQTLKPRELAADLVSHQWVPQEFRRLADWIEAKAGSPARLRDALVLIDFRGRADPPALKAALDPDNLNPLGQPAPTESDPWQAVLACLVLAFPEVHWVFLSQQQPSAERELALLCQAHFYDPDHQTPPGFLRLNEQGFTPLFDPAGLRSQIHRFIAETREETVPARPLVAPYVPWRSHEAVVVEEEIGYAYFLGYTTYRFGYRTHVLGSNQLTQRILGPASPLVQGQPAIAFEDVYLNFPDRQAQDRLSNLEEREDPRRLPRLRTAYRAVVTVGHSLKSVPKNRAFLEKLKEERRGALLLKPLAGVFDVWIGSRLWARNKKWGGRAEGYQWPPAPETVTGPLTTHSAPGRLLMIADRLLARARTIAESPKAVPDAVHGAVLALDAQELLGGRTPTTALDALGLQHECEVQAECMFYGVETSLSVGDRLVDLRENIGAISRYFDENHQEQAAVNAEASIVNQLALRFRNANQFEEELACLARARELSVQVPALKPLDYIQADHERRQELDPPAAEAAARDAAAQAQLTHLVVLPVRMYFTKLANSVGWFLVAIVHWVVVFAILMSVSGPRGDDFGGGRWVVYSAITFFGLGTPDFAVVFGEAKCNPVWPVCFQLALTAEIVAGFFHLGILISLISLKLARR